MKIGLTDISAAVLRAIQAQLRVDTKHINDHEADEIGSAVLAELSSQIVFAGGPPGTIEEQLSALLSRPAPIDAPADMVEELVQVCRAAQSDAYVTSDGIRAVLSALAAKGEEALPSEADIETAVDALPEGTTLFDAVDYVRQRAATILAAKGHEITTMRARVAELEAVIARANKPAAGAGLPSAATPAEQACFEALKGLRRNRAADPLLAAIVKALIVELSAEDRAELARIEAEYAVDPNRPVVSNEVVLFDLLKRARAENDELRARLGQRSVDASDDVFRAAAFNANAATGLAAEPDDPLYAQRALTIEVCEQGSNWTTIVRAFVCGARWSATRKIESMAVTDGAIGMSLPRSNL